MRRRRVGGRVIGRWRAGRAVKVSWLLEFDSGGRGLLCDARTKGRAV